MAHNATNISFIMLQMYPSNLKQSYIFLKAMVSAWDFLKKREKSAYIPERF